MGNLDQNVIVCQVAPPTKFNLFSSGMGQSQFTRQEPS